MRRGERIELLVEKPVYRGLGLARHEGQVVFVPGTVPGDRVLARVEQVGKGFVRARVEELREAGPGRREAPCAYAGRCGGCAYQGVAYATQLALKKDVLLDALRRGHVRWDGDLEVRPSPETGWRTRAALHFEEGPGPLKLGVREEGSHGVVDVERCLQLPDAMMEVALGLRRALEGPAGLHARKVAGALGDLDLAASTSGPGLAAALSVTGHAGAAQPMAAVAREVPGLTGFGLLVPHGSGQRYVHVTGDPHLEADVLGERLRWHVHSFFQSNRFLAEPLARHVRDLVPAGAPVLDLYSGVGLFALPLARRGVPVVAVEGSPSSAEDARVNAERSGLPVRLIEGDVRDVLPQVPGDPGGVVVLDPPRAGAGPEVVQLVVSRAPRAVIYVSCDPPTLARDLAVFQARGYAIDALSAWDLFPDTFHVETVVRLVPAAV
jgi:23S rRNA (uracil1939-C5)-methyltransferase